jgi:threonine synthase
MRFVTTRGQSPAVSLKAALFDGLAPDGGLYMPESIERWDTAELAQLSSRSLVDLAVCALRPFTGGEIDESTLAALARATLDFPIPLVEIESGVHVLELFHGPTLAFKDVGARLMARLMTTLHDGGAPLTVLVATSGDTGSAVAHAFYGVPHTRVAILYPAGRISPTQEAQLTMFNDRDGETNVRAYALAGSFDDCQRLVKAAFADTTLRRRLRLTSANSINIGRLLPQMIYYFHGVAQLRATGADNGRELIVSTPSGNFGNLTAGLMAKRSGLPVARFVAATNVNDVVPKYLVTGRFEPGPSVRTLANAMDVGNPSNFDRIAWMYGGDVDAVRREVVGSRHDDSEVSATIRRVHKERGYVLDPHSAIAYLGLRAGADCGFGSSGPRGGMVLATAHPAKFAEIVEPIIGRAIDKPAPLAAALAHPRSILRRDASLEAVKEILIG